MSTGPNEPEEIPNDGSPKTTPIPRDAPRPLAPKEKESAPISGEPEIDTDNYQASGRPVISPGPAEEDNGKDHDDRGLTTHTGPSD